MKGIGMPQTYIPAPLDEVAKQATQRVIYVGSVLTLPALFLALSGLLRYDVAYYGAIASCLMAAVVLGYVGVKWAGQVRLIEVTDTHLIVRRHLWRAVRIPLTHINAVAMAAYAIDVPTAPWGTRGGVFGYAGEFVSPRYGRVRCMASDQSLLVAIQRVDTPLLLMSPSDPVLFVDGIRTALAPAGVDRK